MSTSFDFQLVNHENGACMDLLTSGKVVLAPCSAKLLSQQWQFVTAGGVPGPIRVVNQLAGQCLEVKDGSLAAGAPLQVSTCVESADHQVWFRLSATADR